MVDRGGAAAGGGDRLAVQQIGDGVERAVGGDDADIASWIADVDRLRTGGSDGLAVADPIDFNKAAGAVGNGDIATRILNSGVTRTGGGDGFASQQAGDAVQPSTVISDGQVTHWDADGNELTARGGNDGGINRAVDRHRTRTGVVNN